MKRAISSRGSALITVIIVILVMVALTAVYVGTATTIEGKNVRDEYRYKARVAAVSGLNRALIELDKSVASNCGHFVVGAGGAPSCFGNIDGNVSDCRVLAASSPVVNKVGNADAYSLDTAATGQDGWADFKDEAQATPGVALLGTEPDGTYTVRCKGVGAAVGTGSGGSPVYAAYHLRSYGVWKGEVVGLDVFARKDSIPSINIAMYGKQFIQGSGQMNTHSWKSGFPPDPGTPYAGATTYVAGTPNDGHGDVATQGLLTLTGQSAINGNAAYGSYTSSGQATISGSQTTTVPPPPTVTMPTANNPTNITGNVSNLSGQNSYSLGSAGNPVASSDYFTTGIQASGQAKISIYPAAGSTIRIFVGTATQSGSINLSGQQALNIVQPAPPALPGIVQFVVEGNNPSVQMSGQSIVDTNPNSAPACAQFIMTGAGSFQISGQGQLFGAIMAPNSSIQFSGQAGMKGMVLGNNIQVSGQGNFEYDMSLANLNQSSSPIYRLFAMVEVAARTQ